MLWAEQQISRGHIWGKGEEGGAIVVWVSQKAMWELEAHTQVVSTPWPGILKCYEEMNSSS